MNLGILGGSFDPIHNAHLQIAKIALKEFNFDKIIFVPAYIPPHKLKLVESDIDRYNMLFNVIKDIKQYDIDTYELDSKKTIYSYQMLDYMADKYKTSKIKMIIGADSFNQLPSWKNSEYILKKYGFIVFQRPNIEIDKKSPYYKCCDISKTMMQDISSTKIRQYLREKKDISQYVPKQVFDYIREQGLYK